MNLKDQKKVLLVSSVLPWLAPFGLFAKEPRIKTATKCLFPSCEVLTTHNGGYCCPNHCKEHRRIQKEQHDNQSGSLAK